MGVSVRGAPPLGAWEKWRSSTSPPASPASKLPTRNCKMHWAASWTVGSRCFPSPAGGCRARERHSAPRSEGHRKCPCAVGRALAPP
eukprot:5742030-Pyramimonas_sp.AAC.1